MSKFVSNKPTTPEPVVQPKEEVNPTFSKVALGMYKIPQEGKIGDRYVLVEIPYDPVTGQAGQAKEVFRDIREDVIDKFKIKVDEHAFFSGV